MSVGELHDLWPPDVTVTKVLSPATILRYQAGQLRKRTKGLIEAQVEELSAQRSTKPTKPSVGDLARQLVDAGALDAMSHVGASVQREKPPTAIGPRSHTQAYLSFDLFAPTLQYRFRLFVIAHRIDLVYPVTLFNADAYGFQKSEVEAPTQEEFFVLVGRVLSSEYTRSVIHSILAQITEKESESTDQPKPNKDQSKKK